MKKTQLAFAILLATGLTSSAFATTPKHHQHKHHSSMSQTSKDTGSSAANPSSQGNVGPGTNQAGSKK